MSPGRVACPPGMFSTAGATAISGIPGASRAAVTMAAITVHAPVLSIFISSIRSAGLMLMPPESKQTPLPTSARWRPASSLSPSSPARMTIIRGGLSLPCPTARNIPMPMSLARFSSMTSIHSPCVGRERGGLVGEDLGRDVVRGAVREPARDVRALAHDPAALGGLRQRSGVAARSRRAAARRSRAARRRCPRGRSPWARTALDHAPRDELGRRGDPALDGRERVEPDRERVRVAPDEPPDARGADLAHDLPVELVGRAAETDTTRLTGQLAAGSQRGAEALAAELAEVVEGRELAAGPAVELAERAGEVRVADDRHHEDVCAAPPTADR